MTPSLKTLVSIFTAISMNSFSLTTYAAPIMDEGDWTLSEVSTNSGVLCVASNRDSGWFRTEVYYLEISKLKNKLDSPAEITLRVENNKRGNQGFIATIEGSPTNFVFTPLVVGEKNSSFVGIGSNLSKIIDLVKIDDEDFEFNGVGGSSTSDFSFDGDGFKEIITAMEKRCNNGTKLVDTKFESFFFQGLPTKLNPLKISIETSQQLRKYYFSAFNLFMQGKEAQTALNALLAKYKPALTELETVRKNLNQIQNIDLPNTRQILAAAQKQQVDAQTEITRLATLIPSLINQVSISKKAFDEASAILAPHVPEHNRLSNSLNNSQSALSDARERYAYIENRLQNLSSQISSLDSEADRLESALPSQRSELNNLRSNLREAEQRRSQYNVSNERDRRIQRDSQHRQLQDERARVNNDLSSADRDLDNIRSERERARRDLEQCKTATPPKDCSSIERAIEVATSQMVAKERTKAEISRRLNDIISQLNNIEDNIDRQVRNEYDSLVNRETEIRTQFDRIDNTVRQNESRLSGIRSVEIPQMERERSQLSSEKPQVSSRIRDLTDDVARLSQELENFKRATDWNRKAADVDRTKTKLRADQNELASANSQKLAAEKSLENGRTVERQSNEKINSLVARATQLDKRAQELEIVIKPLAEERAPLDRKIAELAESLANLRTQFLDLLK